MTMVRVALAAVAALCVCAAPQAQPVQDRHVVFDRVLDTYVRDGFVYYRALKSEREVLDRYIQSLDVPAAQVAAWSHDEQLAFWLNAYDALVLKTVIDRYPIKAVTDDYPARSIRQIPGAFEQQPHRVAGQSLTLDAIEKTKIIALGDARAVIAIGRGALGGGRLRSEAFRAARLEAQLEEAVKEFVGRATIFKIDAEQQTLKVSPLFGWRQDAFIESFAKTSTRWPERSPLERALLEMAAPKLFPSERAFLLQNTFQLAYGTFDWRLNDLTGGIPN